MAFQYDTWVLYPAALGTLVLSKSFVVLKAAVTPRVLPEAITLVTTNSRLTTFGLAAGGVFGGIAAGVAWLWGSAGALIYTALLAVAGTVLCLRIPKWVESTAGEVPATLRATRRGRRTPMSRSVVVALWGNGAIRVLTGFLTLFVAFVIKQTDAEPTQQLLLIGIVGAAAGVGAFVGNAAGSRPRALSERGRAVVRGRGGRGGGRWRRRCPASRTAAVVGLVGATASALAKVSLDAVIQRDLPEESRASAFGRSETVLQLAWVTGGALGVLLPHDTFWIGLHGRGVRRRAGRGADRAAVPRPQHRPVPRGEGPAGGADRARGPGVIGWSGASPSSSSAPWRRCSPGAAAAPHPR